LEKLEEQFELKLPKGASKATVEAGRRFVAKYGKEALSQVAKTHFKTTSQVSL
jgi:ribonuclease HIII